MTDKQIIIDIDRCKYRDKYTNFCLAEKDDIGETCTICTGTDCYFKQLARKTQECEELKEYIQANKATGICETCTYMALIENDRYRKALEEIRKIIISEDVKTRPALSDFEQNNKILDIISKAFKTETKNNER